MSVIEQIKQRKSVRSYTGEPLTSEHRAMIHSYIQSIKSPFDSKIRVEMVRTQNNGIPIQLGTYGFIKDATDFLALIYKGGYLSEVSAGYFFEKVILYCTQLGLGTCWLGGSFKSKDFLRQIHLTSNETLRIVSPVGYKREKRTLLETFMRKTAGSDKRKPFQSLFFKGDFEHPLTENEAGIYQLPLQMLRLAPSASNKQPWRVVMKEDKIHFYYIPSMMGFSFIDLGIGLCHFRETCIEKQIPGELKILQDVGNNFLGKERYLISWVK